MYFNVHRGGHLDVLPKKVGINKRPLRIFVRLRDFIALVIGFVPLTFQRTQSV